MNSVIFIILGAITIFGGLMVIFARNPINSILFLLLTFFALASFYVFLGAPFLAAVQLIVYAGAILVLFLFAVMLLNIGKINEKGGVFLKVLGVVTAGFILIIFINVVSGNRIAGTPYPKMVPTASLGELLFTKYLLPFELASVLLLVAIIGAVILLKRKAG